jgi:hypothetical protein
MKRFIAALAAACALGFPAIASAQSAEKFVVIDVGLSSKTANQLANGSAGSFGVRAAAEFPVLGHNWNANVDYQQFSYQKPSNNAFANGIVAACPTGDPGCVTPIGFNAYATVTPGIAQYHTAFSAVDSATHFGFGPKIARDSRLYLGVGWTWRTFNYTSMPNLSGFGLGLDMLPNLQRPLALYGSFWAYADVHGSYPGAVSPLLGTFSGVPFLVDYRMYTYRVGATFTFPNSPLFADANLNGDRLDVRSASTPSNVVHSTFQLGVGAHI